MDTTGKKANFQALTNGESQAEVGEVEGEVEEAAMEDENLPRSARICPPPHEEKQKVPPKKAGPKKAAPKKVSKRKPTPTTSTPSTPRRSSRLSH